MNFRTISDLNNLINQKMYMIPKDVDLIVGVPRSGMLVADLYALYLNLPVTDFDSMLEGRIYECGASKRRTNWIENIDQARKILIVEDSSYSGNSVKKIKEKIKGTSYEDKIIIMAVYVCAEGKNMVDIYLEECTPPRMFEWNYLHHKGLANACFDIDGVLCEDPTEEENDDGEKYESFISNATLRVVPTFKIGTLITSRLEKYRYQTESWLKKNGIQYDRLIMMNFDTKEERIASGSHGVFKGKEYKKIKQAVIFVESNPGQAEEIANISGKLVFCVGNQQVYEESNLCKGKTVVKRTIKNTLKKVLPYKLVVTLKKIKNKGN